MKQMLKLSLILILLSACSKKKTPGTFAPPQVAEQKSQRSQEQTEKPNNKVDILFVIDNSKSMLVHQRKLRKNISDFVKGFGGTSVDFHIGVTTVFDTTKYYTHEEAPQYNVNAGDRRLEFSQSGCVDGSGLSPLRAMPASGTLIPLSNGQRFITAKTANYQQELENLLNVGWRCGPEFEEVFSPITNVISKDQTNPAVQANKGFLRKDAQLVVFILTDTDDYFGNKEKKRNKYALKLRDKLSLLKENTETITLAAVVNHTDKPACETQEDIVKAKSILGLLSLGENHNMNTFSAEICDGDYGAKLAELGQDVRERIVSTKLPNLKEGFDRASLKVFYGNETSKQELKIVRDYILDEQKDGSFAIVIKGSAQITLVEGGFFTVTYDLLLDQ